MMPVITGSGRVSVPNAIFGHLRTLSCRGVVVRTEDGPTDLTTEVEAPCTNVADATGDSVIEWAVWITSLDDTAILNFAVRGVKATLVPHEALVTVEYICTDR